MCSLMVWTRGVLILVLNQGGPLSCMPNLFPCSNKPDPVTQLPLHILQKKPVNHTFFQIRRVLKTNTNRAGTRDRTALLLDFELTPGQAVQPGMRTCYQSDWVRGDTNVHRVRSRGQGMLAGWQPVKYRSSLFSKTLDSLRFSDPIGAGSWKVSHRLHRWRCSAASKTNFSSK